MTREECDLIAGQAAAEHDRRTPTFYYWRIDGSGHAERREMTCTDHGGPPRDHDDFLDQIAMWNDEAINESAATRYAPAPSP